MPSDDKYEKIIQKQIVKIKKPVKLKAFISQRMNILSFL